MQNEGHGRGEVVTDKSMFLSNKMSTGREEAVLADEPGRAMAEKRLSPPVLLELRTWSRSFLSNFVAIYIARQQWFARDDVTGL